MVIEQFQSTADLADRPDQRETGPNKDGPLNFERERLRVCLEQLVAGVFQLEEILLRMPTRGRAEIARARQAAMYLAHTCCGLSFTEVGQLFERDRTTVAHACAVIEEYREEATFDRAMDMMERSTRIMHMHAFLDSDHVASSAIGGSSVSSPRKLTADIGGAWS